MLKGASPLMLKCNFSMRSIRDRDKTAPNGASFWVLLFFFYWVIFNVMETLNI